MKKNSKVPEVLYINSINDPKFYPELNHNTSAFLNYSFINIEIRLLLFCEYSKDKPKLHLKEEIFVNIEPNNKCKVEDTVLVRLREKSSEYGIIIGTAKIIEIDNNNCKAKLKPTSLYCGDSNFKYVEEYYEKSIKDYLCYENNFNKAFSVDNKNNKKYDTYIDCENGTLKICYDYWLATLKHYENYEEDKNKKNNKSSNKMSATCASMEFIKAINNKNPDFKFAVLDSFIEHDFTEYDILAIKKETKKTDIYDEDNVISVFELKTAGLFSSGNDKDKACKNIVDEFERLNNEHSGKKYNCIYLCFHERHYLNGDNNEKTDFVEELKKVIKDAHIDITTIYLTLSSNGNAFIIPDEYYSIDDIVKKISQ